MSRKNLAPSPVPEALNASTSVVLQREPVRGVFLAIIAFVVCTLMSAAPLTHMAGKAYLSSLPTNPWLLWWGSWLPSNLNSVRASMITTNDLEFVLLMALAFVIYALGALYVRRQAQQVGYTHVITLVLLGALVIGLVYMFTPALLSRDLYVYAGYGRLIVAHHVNPYFSVPAAFPQDPITDLDGWKNATSAYGPLWLAICAFWSLLLGVSPQGYLLAYRLFALGAHLLNIMLVAAILRGLGRSPRTVALGAFLYALNPLALMESSLGAHNDTLMVTLILLGILLCIRAQQHGFARLSHYLPPVVAFTLAALVKFTVAPIIVFYIILLAYHTLHPQPAGALLPVQKAARRWHAAYLKIPGTIATSGLLALVSYAPFWIGHSIHDIINSFSMPPSSYFSENSILRAIYEGLKISGMPPTTSWAYLPLSIFSQHSVWNAIDLVTLVCVVGIGAIWLWRAPNPQTLILASLATLGALLIVTPWFFAWYVTWLVALACACLAPAGARFGRALIAFAFTFSVTSLTTYLFTGYPPLGPWSGLSLLIMYVPLVIVFALFALRGRAEHLGEFITRRENG